MRPRWNVAIKAGTAHSLPLRPPKGTDHAPTAINFRDDALASKFAAFHFFGHGLAKLVEEHECGLIGHAQVAPARSYPSNTDTASSRRDQLLAEGGKPLFVDQVNVLEERKSRAEAWIGEDRPARFS
jgi:hypothetical protein